MVIFALLTIGIVLTAVCAGIFILRREYSHLLRELGRNHHREFLEEERLWGEEDLE